MDIHSRNPSKLLPPLKHLQNATTCHISKAMDVLGVIYDRRPGLPSAQLRKCSHISKQGDARDLMTCIDSCASRSSERTRWVETIAPDSGYASAEEDTDEDDPESEQMVQLCNEPFEKAFVIRWLTGFIARADEWTYTSENGDELDDEGVLEREGLVETAARLLAACASGTCEEGGDIARKFDFPFRPQGLEDVEEDGYCKISVELNDAALSDQDHNSVGLQSWASSIVLSHQLCQDPVRFSLHGTKLRILELGAGTGLLSITAAKVLDALQREAFVAATDYHQDVLSNLRHNVDHNIGTSLYDSVTVEVHTLDWEAPRVDEPFDEPYDIILAADVIYNPLHARWIKNCVERYLRRPKSGSIARHLETTSRECDDGGVFWLIIPIRTTGRHEGIDATVDETFRLANVDSTSTISGERRLEITESAEIARSDGVGRADEKGYRLFKIGWNEA